MQPTRVGRSRVFAKVLLIVVVSALAAADNAHACSCAEPGLYGLIPQHDEVDIVRNVRVYHHAGGVEPSSPAFVDDEGTRTTALVTRIEAGDASTLVFSPSSVLEPERTYALRSGDDDGEWARFTTGREIDEEPPPLPEVRIDSTWSTHYVTSSY